MGDTKVSDYVRQGNVRTVLEFKLTRRFEASGWKMPATSRLIQSSTLNFLAGHGRGRESVSAVGP